MSLKSFGRKKEFSKVQGQKAKFMPTLAMEKIFQPNKNIYIGRTKAMFQLKKILGIQPSHTKKKGAKFSRLVNNVSYI